MSGWRIVVLAVALFSVWPVQPVAAGQVEDANAAYERGEYDRARGLYEAVLDGGLVNERVFYNLGNTYFRLGELGLAIYSYERALAVDPAMVDATFNLDVAREAVTERVGDRLDTAEQQGAIWRLIHHYSLGELGVILLIINALFFAQLVVLRFMGEGYRRTALWVFSAFVGLALAACIVVTAAQVYELESVTEGIVLADEVVLREGASDDRAERGQLHAGLRVEVVATRLGWSRVRLANGAEGWIPSRHLGMLEVGR